MMPGKVALRLSAHRLLSCLTVLAVSLVAVGACGGPEPESPQTEYAPTATIKDIMLAIVDPSADVVWQSVYSVVSANGIEEITPQTDEEWTNVRHGAIRLVEASNLLMMPGRHVARPGERSVAPGVELEPEEMEELINQDREAWNRHAKALHEISLAMLQAIDARDTKAIFDLGEHLDVACENCHATYWYPNQPLPPERLSNEQ